jgi:hypothetical protein
MSSQLTVMICEASETLSNPGSPSHARTAAQKCLANLWKNNSTEVLESAYYILSSQMLTTSKFHALLAIRDLFLRRHEELVEVIPNTTSFLLNGIFSSNCPATVQRTLVLTVATLLKLLLLPPRQQQQQQQHQHLHTLLKMTNSSKSLNILVTLLQQLSQPHGGLTLEIHEKCHEQYGKLYLEQTMHLAINIIQQKNIDEITLAALSLLSEVLAWDFRFCGSSTTMQTSLPIFCPPAHWGPSLLNMNVLLIHCRNTLQPAKSIVDECLLNLAGLHGDVFQRETEQAVFIDSLLRGILLVTRDSNSVYVSSSIIAKALANCKVEIYTQLPKDGEVLLLVFKMMCMSINSLGNLLEKGATIESVDFLARGIDNLLSTLSCLLHKLQTKQIPHHKNGINSNSQDQQKQDSEQSTIRVKSSLLLSRLSPYCNQLFQIFVALTLSQSTSASINHITKEDDENNGGCGTVLTDLTSGRSRYQMMGIIGRMNPDITLPLLSKHLTSELSDQHPDLNAVANIVNLCSCVLVRHNGSTLHRLVPAGVRSNCATIQIIEPLLKIVSNLVAAWQKITPSEPVDWALKNLTRETSEFLICFVKVWIDPVAPASDPLLPELKMSLMKGKIQIIDLIIQYVASILIANGKKGGAKDNLSRAIKRDDRLDFAEVQDAMLLLEILVRKHASCLSKSNSWTVLCQCTTHVHDSNEAQFGQYLSPYVVGKIVELITRGCMVAQCCRNSFENLANVLTARLKMMTSMTPNIENEPVILRLLETIRGMMRCAYHRKGGSNWTNESREFATAFGWSKTVPLLVMCTYLAEQHASVMQDTLVLISVARLWSHFLKVYANQFSTNNFGGVFAELEKLLNTYRLNKVKTVSGSADSIARDESIQAMVICQFAGLLVSLLMTQKHVIVQAYQAKTAQDSGNGRNNGSSSIGDHVVAVVFDSVEKLFTCITPSLLQFTKVCERFVALSCFLVEMFSERLLSGTENTVSGFISCLEFACDSVDEDVSSGALDGMSALVNKCIGVNKHVELVVSRLCHFLLSGLAKDFQNDRAELLYNILIRSTQMQSCARSWGELQADRISKVDEICRSLPNRDLFIRKIAELRLLQKV